MNFLKNVGWHSICTLTDSETSLNQNRLSPDNIMYWSQSVSGDNQLPEDVYRG